MSTLLRDAFWASRFSNPALGAKLLRKDGIVPLLSSAIAHGVSTVDKTVTGNPLTISDFASVSPNVTLLSETGSTTQDGTPTPSAPVEITPLAGYDWCVTVDGSETMVVSGSSIRIAKYHPASVVGSGIGSYLPGDGRTSGARVAVQYGNTLYVVIDGLELDADVYKAYLTAHPLTVWGRSTSYDPTADQYYAVGIEQTDGTYIGIGTTTAIAPLYADDAIDFVSGTVTRNDVVTDMSTMSYSVYASGNPRAGSIYAYCFRNGWAEADAEQTPYCNVADYIGRFTNSATAGQFGYIGGNNSYYVFKLYDSYQEKATIASDLASWGAKFVTKSDTPTTETVTLSADVSTLASATLTGTGTLTVTYKATT